MIGPATRFPLPASLVVLTRGLVAATFLLLIAGGLVTSTGSGLAVPDWPLSYGRVMPPMVGGIRFEHGHRMIAATAGLWTLLLTLWIGRREPRRWVRGLAIAALGAVVVQGILGGLTVLWRLPTPVSVAHAMLGPTFFVLTVLLAAVYNGPPEPSPARGPLAPAALSTATLYAQLILGATLRHAGWAPALVAAHVGIAVVVVASILWTAWRVLAAAPVDPRLARRALWLVGLVMVQLALGLATWAGHRPGYPSGGWVGAATAHVAVGALLLAHAAVLTWRAAEGTVTRAQLGAWARAFIVLTKPRLTLLAVMTTLAGFWLAWRGPMDGGRLLTTLLGTWLLGGAAGTLNQYLERAADARMARTRARPLPAGQVTPRAAALFGSALAAAGLAVLRTGTNGLTAALGALTLASYLALYTPLKTRTTLCTLIGAVPGALPPLIGWAAARGLLDGGAWVLFAVLFLWQLPHFLALAWLHREEYAQAGFRMLPILDPTGAVVGRQMALYCAALLPVSLLPTVLHLAGGVYFVSALALSLAFLVVGMRTAVAPTPAAARRLFLASLAYLPGLLAVMALDKRGV